MRISAETFSSWYENRGRMKYAGGHENSIRELCEKTQNEHVAVKMYVFCALLTFQHSFEWTLAEGGWTVPERSRHVKVPWFLFCVICNFSCCVCCRVTKWKKVYKLHKHRSTCQMNAKRNEISNSLVSLSGNLIDSTLTYFVMPPGTRFARIREKKCRSHKNIKGFSRCVVWVKPSSMWKIGENFNSTQVVRVFYVYNLRERVQWTH